MNENKKEKNFIQYQLRTFAYAGQGIRTFFASEIKAVIHLIAAILAITLGFVFHLNNFEWIAVVVAIGLVFITEMVNTVIEKIADKIEPEKNRTIKEIKDISAGAVLISALAALTIGLLVFIPRLLALKLF